jgi:hypothetical protein
MITPDAAGQRAAVGGNARTEKRPQQDGRQQQHGRLIVDRALVGVQRVRLFA